MTESSVYLTTAAQAERAVAIAAAKKAALKHIDAVAAEKRGEGRYVTKLDGLALLYRDKQIDDDMLRIGRKYQNACEYVEGKRGKNPLDRTPGGDPDTPAQIRADAGRLVSACEACCTTELEKTAVRLIMGQGEALHVATKFFFGYRNGRKDEETLNALRSAMGKMVSARL